MTTIITTISKLRKGIIFSFQDCKELFTFQGLNNRGLYEYGSFYDSLDFRTTDNKHLIVEDYGFDERVVRCNCDQEP